MKMGYVAVDERGVSLPGCEGLMCEDQAISFARRYEGYVLRVSSQAVRGGDARWYEGDVALSPVVS
jgi:hypothetical protein